MAKAKRTTTKRSGKASAKRNGKTTRRAKPISEARSEQSFSYESRIPIIADCLKEEFGGSATRDQLFAKLRTKAGEFNKPRRIDATRRADKRINGDKSVLVLNGKNVELRTMSKAMRKALNRKNKS